MPRWLKVLAIAGAWLPGVAVADSPEIGLAPSCDGHGCALRLTPQQLLASAETLVVQRRFDEARVLLTALRQAPGFSVQTRFLTGYMAAQEGRYAVAAEQYKAILADDPNQTRVRLELGKAMIALGQTSAADRQLRMAQQDDLPADVAQLVRGARDVIRGSRSFRANVNFGFAPDSNINNATAARSIDVHLGDVTLPLQLNDDARSRSGTGQTASLSTASRLPVGGDLFMLANVDLAGTNYRGKAFDDYQAQLGAGGEVQVSDTSSVSLQAVGAQRWYGGSVVSRQVGLRAGLQRDFGERDRVGVQLDTRRTNALFDAGYDGWQTGLYASLEHALGRRFLLSAGPFVRRDWLREAAYSNVELGLSSAIGGELPHGFNVAGSLSVSRAMYDAPVRLFALSARRDWRLSGRASLGYRGLRFLGFSPQLTYQRNDVASSIGFYRTARNRLSFELARYF